MAEAPDNTERRLSAKRANESLRLTANLLNNFAVGILVAGMIAPSVSGRPLSKIWYGLLLAAVLGLHLAARALLQSLKSEE